jgi:hypothetical protein
MAFQAQPGLIPEAATTSAGVRLPSVERMKRSICAAAAVRGRGRSWRRLIVLIDPVCSRIRRNTPAQRCCVGTLGVQDLDNPPGGHPRRTASPRRNPVERASLPRVAAACRGGAQCDELRRRQAVPGDGLERSERESPICDATGSAAVCGGGVHLAGGGDRALLSGAAFGVPTYWAAAQPGPCGPAPGRAHRVTGGDRSASVKPRTPLRCVHAGRYRSDPLGFGARRRTSRGARGAAQRAQGACARARGVGLLALPETLRRRRSCWCQPARLASSSQRCRSVSSWNVHQEASWWLHGCQGASFRVIDHRGHRPDSGATGSEATYRGGIGMMAPPLAP